MQMLVWELVGVGVGGRTGSAVEFGWLRKLLQFPPVVVPEILDLLIGPANRGEQTRGSGREVRVRVSGSQTNLRNYLQKKNLQPSKTFGHGEVSFLWIGAVVTQF